MSSTTHQKVADTTTIATLSSQGQVKETQIPPAEKDVALLRTLNDQKSGPRNLAPEILSAIFDLARCEEAEDKAKGHRTLAAVCSRWRQTVELTSLFWTKIRLYRISENTVGKRAAYLRLCIQRSSGRPLDLSLSFMGVINEISDLFSPDIDGLLVENRDRIHSLFLESPPLKWYSFIPQLTHLSSLTLKMNPRSYYRKYALSFPSITHLNRLNLFYTVVSFGDLRTNGPLEWSTITTIDLTGIAIDTCVTFLFNCPNLESFLCYETDAPQRPRRYGETSTRPVILQHLKRLRWPMVPAEPHNESSAWCRDILKRLHVPALERLDDIDASWSYGDDFVQFTNRLPLTMKTLAICKAMDPRWNYAYHQNILSLCIQRGVMIERIELSYCTRGFFGHILTMLSTKESGAVPLPHLTYIDISHLLEMADHVFSGDTDWLFINALKGRIKHVKEFTFEVTGAMILQESRDTEKILAQWRESGFNVMFHSGLVKK